MDATKTARSTALGRVSRTARVVLAAAGFAVISTAVPAWSPATALAPLSSTVVPTSAVPLTLAIPHVLAGDVADVIVRIRGGGVCTGTPITGTTYVVTAAHCVLDADGEVSRRTVLRDGVEYAAESVLVNPEYHDSPGSRLDAAVLIMDRAIEGPSAILGNVFPAQGAVTIAGFQPLDSDGTLLRGTRYDERPLPKGVTSGVIQIDSAAAGCVHLVSDLEIKSTGVIAPCGLIPGSSGGGLFVETDGDLILVGIISTVAADLTDNGLVPLTALHELLENPAEYTHEMPPRESTRAIVGVGFSPR